VLSRNVVSLERFVAPLHQGVEGGLDDVVLVEVGSIDAGASLLHACRFHSKVTKMCWHVNRTRVERSYSKQQKLDCPFWQTEWSNLSGSTIVRGAARL
jgi:hypothetical protein